MKRKLLVTILCLAISVSMIACGNVDTTEQQEVTATEQTTETEIIETSTEQVEENTSEQVEQANISEGVDTSTSETSEYNNDESEIQDSKWADINGAWDAVHQYTLYAQSQGADGTGGWCWIYFNGKGAGDQPSYAVYMKEGDPLYGTVYHVGDYLPSGELFSGTNDEWEAFIAEDMIRQAQEEGLEVTEEDGAYVIHLD